MDEEVLRGGCLENEFGSMYYEMQRFVWTFFFRPVFVSYERISKVVLKRDCFQLFVRYLLVFFGRNFFSSGVGFMEKTVGDLLSLVCQVLESGILYVFVI